MTGKRGRFRQISTLIENLKDIVGAGGWTSDPDRLEPHLTEWRDLVTGATPIMVMPSSTEQVSRVVRACHAQGAAIVPQGGNTGLCGGAIPDHSGTQVLLNLSRLNRIRAIDARGFTMTVEAGCILADAQAAAADADRFFPLSLSAEGSCQIGGNLSTNAGGINVVRYGTARDLVLGLEVVLADGEIWNGLRSLRKDTAGYDLKQLFVGSEGTLGVITAAVLKLFPMPEAMTTAFVAIPDATVATALLESLMQRFPDRIQSFELVGASALDLVLKHIPDTRSPFDESHPWYVLMEIETGARSAMVEETLAGLCVDGEVIDAVIAKNVAESEALWRIRHTASEAQKHEGKNVKHDISVPVSCLPDFIVRCKKRLDAAYPGVRTVVFGHIGDGNLHYNVYPPGDARTDPEAEISAGISEVIYELVDELGGSISAEHGIGSRKRALLARYRGGTELELMRRVKSALDPRNTLNPGKVI